MDRIIDYLKQLELSDVEAKLYLTLLKTGPLSVRDLAETVEIKRTTAYLYIDQLVEKGLIMKVVKGANKLVAANDPDQTLQYLVKAKLQKAERLEATFPSMIEILHTSLPQIKDVSEAEIKYYKGRNGVMKIYEDALKSKEIRSYVNIEEVLTVFPENAQLFDRALRSNPDIQIFEICEDSPEAKKRKLNSDKNHFYKILPKDMKLTSQDVLIYQNKVAIIHFKDNTSGVILSNKDLYNNFKLLFDFLWKMLPE